MTAKSPIGLPRGSHNFSSALSSAVLEWLLMLFLFLDGLFSYLLTRFARFFGLQTPCLICSRLECILGSEKPCFYRDLICFSHKLEISSSAYCHAHQKLADVHDMCEDCLFSFATENKSNTATYKSLVGKLRVDINHTDRAHLGSPATVNSNDQHSRFDSEDAAEAPLPKDLILTPPLPRHCSCCSKPFKNESHAIRLLSEPFCVGVGVDVDVAESGFSLTCLTRKNCVDCGLSMTVEENSVSPTVKHSSSHIGYSEVRVASDSESDVPFSDDDNGHTSIHGTRDLKKEFATIKKPLVSPTTKHSGNNGSGILSHVEYSELKVTSDSDSESDVSGSDDDNGNTPIHRTRDLKKDFVTLERPLVSPTIKHLGNIGSGILSHIEYSELKVTSDSESDVPFSYDDNGHALTHQTRDPKKEFVIREMPLVSLTVEHLGTTGSEILSHIGYSELKVTSDSESDVPYSYDDNGHTLTHQTRDPNNEFVTREMPLVSPTVEHLGATGSEILSHIGYSELKVTSDSESDVPFSDDDNGQTLGNGTSDLKQEFMNRCLQPDTVTIFSNSLSRTLSSGQTLERLIHMDPTLLETSQSVVKAQLSDSHDIPNMVSMSSNGHGKEELNGCQDGVRTNPPVPSEIIAQQVLSEFSNAKAKFLEIGDDSCASNTPGEELLKILSSTEKDTRTNQIRRYPGPSLEVPVDLNDVYKIAIRSNSSLASPTLTEIITGTDTYRANEDLKSLGSQMSSTGGLESPWNDLFPSPRVNCENDDSKFSDASSTAVLRNITNRLYIERNESGMESPDGSIVSEIEGESVTSRLKRQVELDRKSLSLLYRELEEERNASAIAANQAMAMITRLQEEKAAMQMEALQYQRMMEDQAEYDQEALQKSQELVYKMEKEIHCLEAQVENYKKQFTDDLLEHRKSGISTDVNGSETNPTSTLPDKLWLCSNLVSADASTIDVKLSEVHLKGSLLDFEDETMYLSDCMKRLEEQLQLFLNNKVDVDESRDNAEDKIPSKTCAGLFGENHKQENTMLTHNVTKNSPYEAAGRNDLKTSHWGDVPQEKGRIEYHLIEKKESNLKCYVSPDDGDSRAVSRENDLVAFTNEVFLLTERLVALEADQRFLEYSINQLKTGNAGIKFIQEIAYHLREFRRIGITHR